MGPGEPVRFCVVIWSRLRKGYKVWLG